MNLKECNQEEGIILIRNILIGILGELQTCDARFIHPGEDIAEHLEELGLSQAEFAEVLGVTTYRVSQIMNRRAPITPDMAVRIGRAFRQSAEFWMRLQLMYDLEVAQATVDVSAIEPLYEPLPDDWEPPMESEEDARRRDAGEMLVAVADSGD